MINRVALFVVCMIVMSACDSGGTAPPARTSASASDSFIPIDLETAPESLSGMIMSGALDHNSGDVSAYAMERNVAGPSYQQIDIDTRTDYILRLVHLIGLPEGEYPITTSANLNPPDNEFSAGLLNLWSPDEAEQYTVNPQGTVTLSYDGEYVNGDYSLTVQNLAGDTVTINGQYHAKIVRFIEG